MQYVLVYHHEHAFDNEPTAEKVYGPMSLEEGKEALVRLCDAINKGRDKEESGLWEISPDGTYLGMNDEDYERLGMPDIHYEVWANVQPLADELDF